MKRVVLFIDGSNFYYGLKSIYKNSKSLSEFNFRKLGVILSEDRELKNVFYYNAPLDFNNNPEKYAKQQRFFEKIRKTEKVILKLSRLQKRKIKGTTDRFYYVVKGDDIHIAAEMVKEAYENSFDTAILVSGDGDFVPAIKIVQNIDKKVENAYFKQGMSWELKQNCNKSVRLTKEILDSCFDTKDNKLTKEEDINKKKLDPIRKTYKFSSSVFQGGYLYAHRTIKKGHINNKGKLRDTLEKVAKKFELIDITIKIYDSIFFLFFMVKPIIKPIEIIESIQKAISSLENEDWDKEYLYTGVYDLQEDYVKKDLKKLGFNYDKG